MSVLFFFVFSLVSTIFVLSFWDSRQTSSPTETVKVFFDPKKPYQSNTKSHLKRYLPRDSMKKTAVFSLSPDQINNFLEEERPNSCNMCQLGCISKLKRAAVFHRNGWRWCDDRRPVLLRKMTTTYTSCMEWSLCKGKPTPNIASKASATCILGTWNVWHGWQFCWWPFWDG